MIQNYFNAVSISIASPEQILAWSHGEVKKPETINYRTQKAERDGLFCERIFGPTKNYECYCGKYKRIRYKGIICEKCGVEVTHSKVRRERMGHIKLAVPVTHIWFLRSTPSRVGLLLNLPIRTIEQVVYFASYIVISVNEGAKQKALSQLDEEFKMYKQKALKELKDKIIKIKNNATEDVDKIKTEVEKAEKETAVYLEDLESKKLTAKEELNMLKATAVLSEFDFRNLSMKFGHVFKAGTGAESIREIINSINLHQKLNELKEELKKISNQKKKKVIKRIKLIGSLLKANIKPEWMILTVLPVIPPDLRPMVQLDGGRFAASDLNDLYRRVINRNNRLKRLIAIGAPEVICRNEKRMLQEAIDCLLCNSNRGGKTVFNIGNKRKLRSLSDMLKGKQGRFRQNLLGKRVDYSGRSVIVVGPQLKLHQCGIPKKMALELFKPFVIGSLIRDGFAPNMKQAEKIISAEKSEVWDALQNITQKHYVLLNRAPTLHRLGIQAFQPILTEGSAIQIHPLVCAAFNADFDGDQMAVHVPLSREAQIEARDIMLASKNLLKPSSGVPTTTPTQDMVLGCYYLTKLKENDKKDFVFANLNEAITAYRHGYVHLQSQIRARVNGEIIETSVGRLIFNSFLPEKLQYQNKPILKESLRILVSECFEKLGQEETAKLCDNLKHIGFKFATKSGLTFSMSDLLVPKEKPGIIQEAEKIIDQINEQFQLGLMNNDERYQQTVQTWSRIKSAISDKMAEGFKKTTENDILFQIESGARGNWGQVTQLCGMKGLVLSPSGRIIELPIKESLKEGFKPLSVFIAAHGGRKGKVDTALKTAEAGYLTRRLVDAVQDVIVKAKDCGSTYQHTITRGISEKTGEAFENRIFGRVVSKPIVNPNTGEIILDIDQEIDINVVKQIQELKINEVVVRAIFACNTENGICQKCYGKNLGTNATVELGAAVGILAAQSIGEPGTQLTMRTFHSGGVAGSKGEEDITQGLTRVEELFEARSPKNPAVLSEVSGTVIGIFHKKNHTEVHVKPEVAITHAYPLETKMEIKVKIGELVKEKQVLAKSPFKRVLRTMIEGRVAEINDHEIKITEKNINDQIYTIPTSRTLMVKNKDNVTAGTALCRGAIDLRELLRLKGPYEVQKYIIKEVQNIYANQGQTINDKHIEIVVTQMLSKSRVVDSGESNFLIGQVIENNTLKHANKKLAEEKKKSMKAEQLLLGLTRISLHTSSWLAAASFQETIRVLVEAATTKRVDLLSGLKENVIIGRLIPAGKIFQDMMAKKALI
ncbi:DNA-directed RNA polymerase subunit beta' [Candidatus Peregrinibacteria bacterium RIFOXYB2_FULL_32_7]|nr:MAG: DNA-directed RNA polymerase subunit beta' [Candidatus Peregrinibacteria bacterium RIFOXYB2_FULL_32_7]